MADRIASFCRLRTHFAFVASLILASTLISAPIIAQDAGPMPQAAPQDAPIVPKDNPSPGPAQISPGPTTPRPADQPVTKDAPPIAVDQIVKTFAQHESEFKAERNNFDYTQDLDVQTVDDDGKVDGEFKLTSDFSYTHDGKLQEYVTYAPESTLDRIQMTEEDMNDLKNITPFVLTTEDLPKYDVTYVGRQQVDQLGTYVFDVAPKTIVKGQRYFQGRIWVEDKDLEIVKTKGKAVPDIITRSGENVFPTFEMYRDNIEGHYWFPVYAHADELLKFKNSPGIQIRETVRWENYKRFRVSSRVVPNSQAPVNNK